MLKLDYKTTALILIDLQKGIVGAMLAPYTGQEVVKTASELADRFREKGAPVVLVNVGWLEDLKDVLSQEVDKTMAGHFKDLPDDFSELAAGLAKNQDILITKRQWGAFYGTELDLQLRRRGIKAIVLAGIATNMGVESTARQAWEHGYSVVIAENATSSLSSEMHDFSINQIMPLISRVVKINDISLE